MEISITVRGDAKLTDTLKEKINGSVGKLTKYSNKLSRAEVRLNVEKHCIITHITLHRDNTNNLEATSENNENMYAVIDDCVAKLEKQLRRS